MNEQTSTNNLLTEALRAIRHLNHGAPGDDNAPEISSPVYRAMIEAGFINGDGENLLGRGSVRVPLVEVQATSGGLEVMTERAGYEIRLNTASDKPELRLPDAERWVPCSGTARAVWLDQLSVLATIGGRPWRLPAHLEQQMIVAAAARNPEEGEGSDTYEATLTWLRGPARGLDIQNAPDAVQGMRNARITVLQKYESSYRLPPDVRGDVLRALRRVCGDKRSVREGGKVRKFWRVPGVRRKVKNAPRAA